MDADALDRFSPAAQAWFASSFAAPTAAQAGAWQAISSGSHALVVAPTGSGKTLAAFLWALDQLTTSPQPAEPAQRCRVLYISPLKALASDVERNLRAPLAGLGHAAARLGQPAPDIRVAIRTGDTPAADRRSFARTPPDVLITTPESLFLLLTSQARTALAGIRTVIVDEVHSLAGSKRGAHLALSLERLDHLLTAGPAQRIGLSATVRPAGEVARWLGGPEPVRVVQPPAEKEFDLRVVVPVADLTALDERPADDLTEPAPPYAPSSGQPAAVHRPSIWPHVEERLVDLIADHRSTLVFANSRRLAERLTARLNEEWAQRPASGLADEYVHRDPGSLRPAEVMAQADAAVGAPAVLARAHHGSVSREQRGLIESELKAGRLPAVVATSSLELGIDMGAVDLVVQVESPPSVASGLQRVGRAGHQVGAVSRGVLFPKHRGDLVQTAVVVERMRTGQIEQLRVPANPLDVLAQQIVAMTAMDDWPVADLAALIQRATPFSGLTRPVLESVLDMLSGRYPSDEFAELRPRLVWDRHADLLTARPGAQRLAVTSGGTIPDRGLYGVFLAGGEGTGGRRVGELDEEMVYESRVGDVFTLGSSSWRIEDITHDRVLVTPAPGQPGRLPFWHGDALGRPAELGAAVGAFVRELTHLPPDDARKRAAAAGLDDWAVDNLLDYLDEQRAATRQVPDDRTIVIERCRDELGDWRVVVHSPFGGQVHAPWALALGARLRERFGVPVQSAHSDDGIVVRLPDVDTPDGSAPSVAELVAMDPEEITDLVTAELGGSALFAARFRECAARALLLPRRRPGQRQPLWQQRQRSAQLLAVASQYGSFPIVLEAVRECLQDVFDVPALQSLLRDIAARRIRLVEVETPQASPFAKSMLFGYVAQFLYEGDAPLAERRAAALALDPELLAELLGQGAVTALRDLLDPAAVARTEAELQRLAEHRRARDREEAADLLRLLGPLSTPELAERCTAADQVPGWLAELAAARRVIEVRIAGQRRWAAVEDAARLRDALGIPLPTGIAEAFLQPVADPLGDLLSRYARTHGPFTAGAVADRLGLGPAPVIEVLDRLTTSGRLARGEILPLAPQPPTDPAASAAAEAAGGLDYCDAEVLRTIRRRSLAALRAEVEPVTGADLARFLPAWQGIADGPRRPGAARGDGGQRGVAGVLRAVEQLAGAWLPASALETLVLPTRVPDYSPAMLDELTAAGEVVWSGHASLPGNDGWVALHPADLAPATLAEPGDEVPLGDLHQRVLSALAGGGGYFFRNLSDALGGPDDTELVTALWELTWSGRITNDTLAPLRAKLSGGRASPSRARRPAPRGRYGGLSRSRLPGGSPLPARPGLPSRAGPPTAAGRWSLLPAVEPDLTIRLHGQAEVLLDRHGVVTRAAVAAERVPGGFAAAYRVLAAFEDAGRVRRGYFVEGLGAAQFGTTGAIDRLRASTRPPGTLPTTGAGSALVLAAADPANPYGAALPWPERPADGASGHRPGRSAGALVVLVDGELVLYVERGGRSVLSWSDDEAQLVEAARALAGAVRAGALGRITVSRADGSAVLAEPGPLTRALAAAGFAATPRGLRLAAGRGRDA